MRARHVAIVAVGLCAGCGGDFSDDYNLIERLRLIAVKAEPAEAAPGDTVFLRAWAFDPTSPSPAIDWAACTEPPVPGTGTINSACLTVDQAPFLIPLGQGAMVTAAVPTFAPDTLGPPDYTGGRYLPIRLRLTSAGDQLDGIERLRVTAGGTPNHNPTLAEVSRVTEASDGGVIAMAALDEATPLEVHAGDQLILRAHFADGSVERYSVDNGDGTMRPVDETLNVTWFSTAGHFSVGSDGPDADTTLALDRHLPAAGATIDLWAVGRDERGGLDVLHRSLILR